MPPYDVYLFLGLLDTLPRSSVKRRQIMDFIRSLRDQPGTPGDYSEKDTSLRERQVKIVGDRAIVCWVDEAVRAVMIVDIRPAD